MFEDSLLESSGALARRNPWTTAASFAAQLLAAVMLVLLSLIYTETLPTQRLASMLEAPAPPQAPAPVEHVVARAAGSSTASELDHNVLRLPARIPSKIAMVQDEGPAPLNATGVVGDRPGGVSNGTWNGVMDVIGSGAPVVPRTTPAKVRVSSGVAQGLLLRQVKPQYPPLAAQARIEGTVVLQATIGKDGTVQELRLVSGHPMLTAAAIDAVKQWLYKPFYLNGEAVVVETQVNVIFTLAK